MKSNMTPPPTAETEEDLLRDYAYHLYLHQICMLGSELDVWHAALACLRIDGPPMPSLGLS